MKGQREGKLIVDSDGQRVHRRPHWYRPLVGRVPVPGLEVVTV